MIYGLLYLEIYHKIISEEPLSFQLILFSQVSSSVQCYSFNVSVVIIEDRVLIICSLDKYIIHLTFPLVCITHSIYLHDYTRSWLDASLIFHIMCPVDICMWRVKPAFRSISFLTWATVLQYPFHVPDLNFIQLGLLFPDWTSRRV